MLTMRHKKAITKELRNRYQRASKKEKTMMLNEFVRLTWVQLFLYRQSLKDKKSIMFSPVTTTTTFLSLNRFLFSISTASPTAPDGSTT